MDKLIANMKNIAYLAKQTNHQHIKVKSRETKKFLEEIDNLAYGSKNIDAAKLILEYIKRNIGTPYYPRIVDQIHKVMQEEQEGGTPIVLWNGNIYEFYIELPGTGPCAPLGQTIVKRIVKILDNTDTTWFISNSTLTVVFE